MGNFHLFVAEMRENGPGYLTRTEPTATYAVTIRLSDMAVIDERLAPNSSPSLYGFSVTSDASSRTSTRTAIASSDTTSSRSPTRRSTSTTSVARPT